MILKGKLALVTGGANGIGLATVRLLAERGVRVVIADIDDRRGGEVASELGVGFLHADVGDEEAWADLRRRVEERYEGLDIAVLNAGIGGRENELGAMSDAVVGDIWRVNVGGVLHGLRTCADLMAGRRGSIVVTCSVAAFHPVTIDPLYAMTKHAVMGLCRSLVPQLEARGIALNLTCPSVADTQLVRSNAALMAQIHRNAVELLDPAVVAEAAVSLITSGGTGQAVVCRHGQVPAPWTFHDA